MAANSVRIAGLLLVLVAFCGPAAGADIAQIRQELSDDIESARNALSAVEENISSERAELATRLNTVQNRVLDLRQRAVAARRAADEETLSLSRIENRIEDWEAQSQFQSRLLAGYLDRIGRRSLGDTTDVSLEDNLQIFGELITEQEARLYPAWQQERVIKPNGQIEDAVMLNLGPVHLFLQPELQLSGLVNSENDMNRVILQFSSQAHEGIDSLYQAGSGSVVFDPTLSRALLLAEDDETMIEHLQKGGIWVIPILLFALFASVIAIFKAIALWRLPVLLPALAERVESALKESPHALDTVKNKVRGCQRELLAIALTPQSSEQRDDRLYTTLLEQRNKLERWLGAIAMTASVSPLLGLLGTVSGMITTFKLMTLFGAGDANSVSAGISEALVTTELGLVVAIPALLAHALMSRKVKAYFSQLEGDAVHLSRLPLQGSRT